MKKFLSLLLFVPYFLSAQVVTTTPSVVNDRDVIEVVFDATKGNGAMVGATECYAHTGLITSNSTGTSDWKYAPNWLDNSAKYKMTSLGSNKWKLTLSPNIRTYYGVADAAEKIKQLAFVFRSGDGSKVGKDTGNQDIFVTIPQHVEFLSPSKVTVTSPSSSLDIVVGASDASTLSLFMNDVNSAPLKTATATTVLNYTTTLPAGNYNLIAQAIVNGVAYRDTAYICSFNAPFSKKVRPTGLKEGVTRNADGSVTFCIFAPYTSSMFLLADFNNFKPATQYVMNYDYEGFGATAAQQRYYWITVPKEVLDPNKEYAYQFLVDRTIRIADPYGTKILDPWNDKWISNSVYPDLKAYPTGFTTEPVSTFKVNKDMYSWEVSNFVAPLADNLRIYELHFRDFTTEGTVKAAMQKLDYIKSLGMNAIELMPIQEFDGNDSWGYNPNFYFATDKAYGTDADYKQFIDECHKRGIAVILDVVFNHSWGQHPWCKLYWDSANGRPAANNPFYNAVAPHPYSVGNDFKHSNPDVRNYFKNVLAYWMNEYRVDGYRFDLSKGLTDRACDETSASWYDTNRISYLKEYNSAIKAVNPNAYTILEHFCADNEESELGNNGMMVWRNLSHSYGQSAMGFSQESDFSRLFAGTSSMPASCLMGFMESHDEERATFKAMTNGESSIKASLDERMKQAATNAAFFLTVPGAKMVWQFGELGYDISIEQGGRTGRKPILWNYFDDVYRKRLYDTYSKLNALRNSYPDLFSSLSTFNWQVSESYWSSGRFISIESQDKQKHVVVVGNFTNAANNINIAFPHAGTWYNHMDDSSITVTTSQVVQIPAHEFKLYTDFKPVITGINNTITTSKEVLNVAVYSINGTLIKQLKELSTVNDLPLDKGCYIIRCTYTDGTSESIKMMK